MSPYLYRTVSCAGCPGHTDSRLSNCPLQGNVPRTEDRRTSHCVTSQGWSFLSPVGSSPLQQSPSASAGRLTWNLPGHFSPWTVVSPWQILMSSHLVVAISSVILVVWQLLRFWLAAAAAAVVVDGALLQCHCLAGGQCDGRPSVSHPGRSASAQVFLGVKLGLGRCWRTAGAPTLTAWTEVWLEIWPQVWPQVWTSEVEGEVRGREVWE